MALFPRGITGMIKNGLNFLLCCTPWSDGDLNTLKTQQSLWLQGYFCEEECDMSQVWAVNGSCPRSANPKVCLEGFAGRRQQAGRHQEYGEKDADCYPEAAPTFCRKHQELVLVTRFLSLKTNIWSNPGKLHVSQVFWWKLKMFIYPFPAPFLPWPSTPNFY